jgi:hypothetical protein
MFSTLTLTFLLALPGCSAKLSGSTAAASEVEQDLASLSDDIAGIFEKKEIQCSQFSEEKCPQSSYEEKEATCADFDNKDQIYSSVVELDGFPIPIGTGKKNGFPTPDGLPTSMQGVFWLTDQNSSSALVSFAHTADGGGLSSLETKGEKGIFKIRVAGDRGWSFHDHGKNTNFDRVAKADLVYEFQFSPMPDPTKAQIYPHLENYGVSLGRFTQWLLDFEMYLLECDKTPDDPYCESLDEAFKESVVWQRKSKSFGVHIKSADYKCVQVIDENGRKLPAFYKWIKYCNSGDTGNTPGVFHYRSIKKLSIQPNMANIPH